MDGLAPTGFEASELFSNTYIIIELLKEMKFTCILFSVKRSKQKQMF